MEPTCWHHGYRCFQTLPHTPSPHTISIVRKSESDHFQELCAFHTSQTSILSDFSQTITEQLHIHYTFIHTHNPSSPDMLTSRLQMLPNTSLCTLTTYNFNCREIGDGCVLTHISHPSSILTLLHIHDSPHSHRWATRTLSLPFTLIHHCLSYTTSSFLLSLLLIA